MQFRSSKDFKGKLSLYGEHRSRQPTGSRVKGRRLVAERAWEERGDGRVGRTLPKVSLILASPLCVLLGLKPGSATCSLWED